MTWFPGDHFDGDDAYPLDSPKRSDYFERYAELADRARKYAKENPPEPADDEDDE